MDTRKRWLIPLCLAPVTVSSLSSRGAVCTHTPHSPHVVPTHTTSAHAHTHAHSAHTQGTCISHTTKKPHALTHTHTYAHTPAVAAGVRARARGPGDGVSEILQLLGITCVIPPGPAACLPAAFCIWPRIGVFFGGVVVDGCVWFAVGFKIVGGRLVAPGRGTCGKGRPARGGGMGEASRKRGRKGGRSVWCRNTANGVSTLFCLASGKLRRPRPQSVARPYPRFSLLCLFIS